MRGLGFYGSLGFGCALATFVTDAGLDRMRRSIDKIS